jgi:hypothetical protein
MPGADTSSRWHFRENFSAMQQVRRLTRRPCWRALAAVGATNRGHTFISWDTEAQTIVSQVTRHPRPLGYEDRCRKDPRGVQRPLMGTPHCLNHLRDLANDSTSRTAPRDDTANHHFGPFFRSMHARSRSDPPAGRLPRTRMEHRRPALPVGKGRHHLRLWNCLPGRRRDRRRNLNGAIEIVALAREDTPNRNSKDRALQLRMDNKCIREAMSNPKLWRGSTRCLIDGIAVLACYETACLFETLNANGRRSSLDSEIRQARRIVFGCRSASSMATNP